MPGAGHLLRTDVLVDLIQNYAALTGEASVGGSSTSGNTAARSEPTGMCSLPSWRRRSSTCSSRTGREVRESYSIGTSSTSWGRRGLGGVRRCLERDHLRGQPGTYAGPGLRGPDLDSVLR